MFAGKIQGKHKQIRKGKRGYARDGITNGNS